MAEVEYTNAQEVYVIQVKEKFEGIAWRDDSTIRVQNDLGQARKLRGDLGMMFDLMVRVDTRIVTS